MALPKLPLFTKAQIKLIDSKLAEVFSLLDAQKLASKIHKWKAGTAHEVLNNPLFGADIPEDNAWDPTSKGTGTISGVENELIPIGTAYDTIELFYKNQIRYYKCKLKARAPPAVNSSKPAIPAACSDLADSSSGSSSEKFTMTALWTMLTFQGQFPARELFAYKNQEALDEEIKQQCASMSTEELQWMEGAPIRQKALKVLFDLKQQKVYEKKMKEIQGDIKLSGSLMLMKFSLDIINFRLHLLFGPTGVACHYCQTSRLKPPPFFNFVRFYKTPSLQFGLSAGL
ncbi:hypothetical protein H1R20_g868, partial [Candolleomyces eurysporus]